MLIKWPEIEAFHSVRKTLCVYPELLGANKIVTYRGKVKLHGTNAAVQVRGDKVFCQSRTSIVAPGSDNAGFAAWVELHRDEWTRVCASPTKSHRDFVKDGIIVFGEWCGPGVQKGVAICQVPRKVFAVFAIQPLTSDGSPSDVIVYDPKEIDSILKGSPSFPLNDVHVIPWLDGHIDVPWLESPEVLEPITTDVSSRVLEVEKCDPFVKETFGVEGTGEGIVWYPISHPGRKHFGDLCFKAKGEQHKMVAKTRPAQVDPSVAASLDEFAQMVCTPARLEQGVREIAGGEFAFSQKLIGQFVSWVSRDVEKETAAEREASGLDAKLAKKACVDHARKWYVAQLEKLL